MDAAEVVRQTATCPPMVVLRPGDRVLVFLAAEVDQAMSNEIAYSLRMAFPGTDFTVMTGVAGIVVGNGGA